MTVTTTYTVREIVTDACLLIEVGTLGQALVSEEAELGRRELNRMLKSWQMQGHPAFLTAHQTLTLTTAASYTLSPVRPLRIINANLKQSGIETPMYEMTRMEYEGLPDKTSTGLPTQFHYDRQREAALFYVWPLLSAANGETVEIAYEREIEDTASLNDTLDLPVEWHDAAVWGLASQLGPYFGKQAQMVTAMAQAKRNEALGASAMGSVYFGASHG